MFNQELRFPLLNRIIFGTPLGDLTFPEVQGALFFDVGRAWFEHSAERAVLGSWGASFRMALAPLAVIRLDVGRRFSSKDFAGYALNERRRRPSFVTFFFGYNY
jgi:outer membrane protein assembly factor BamA